MGAGLRHRRLDRLTASGDSGGRFSRRGDLAGPSDRPAARGLASPTALRRRGAARAHPQRALCHRLARSLARGGAGGRARAVRGWPGFDEEHSRAGPGGQHRRQESGGVRVRARSLAQRTVRRRPSAPRRGESRGGSAHTEWSGRLGPSGAPALRDLLRCQRSAACRGRRARGSAHAGQGLRPVSRWRPGRCGQDI